MSKNMEQVFDYGNYTDKGRVKDKNEDFYGMFNTPNGSVVVMCDGMGGHASGALASEIAVNSIREYFESNVYEDVPKAIEDAIIFANNQIFDEAKENEAYIGMGTTCVLCLVKANTVYYAHVGDSRLYIYRDQKLTQLTKDHSYVQKLIDSGEIKPEEAASHPRRNELIRAVGVSDSVEVEVASEPLCMSNKELLLICTDGLTNMVNENTIEYTLAQHKNATFKAQKLCELAIKEGGYDNISVQVLAFNNLPQAGNEESVKQKITFNGLLMKYIPFFRKYPKAIYGIYLLLALLFAYAVYDLFFKQSKIPFNQEVQTVDSLNTSVNEQNVNTTLDTTTKADPLNDNKPAEANKVQETEKPNTQPASNVSSEATYLTYTVKKGDALSLLSQRFNIKSAKLMEVNKLSNATIREGQQIKIPLQAIYTIKAGDNLYDIAKKFNVSRNILRKTNRLKSDSDIKVGDNLYIPYP